MKLKLTLLFFLCFSISTLKSQISSINTVFPNPGYTFYSSDTNNYLYNKVNNYNELTNLIDSICPFYTSDYFSNLNEIITADSITKLAGLHNQVPWKDTEFTEIKSSYLYKNKTSHWYGFYKKSWGDTNVAILAIPGSGTFESFQIATGTPGDYHNMNGIVRKKCLQYGDFYVYSKQNENFNSIWKINGTTDKRLDYDYFTPYTDYNGKHWAANMYIDLVAAIKYLKKKYRKVIVLGLSNGGFPALICGLQGGADGINCASGISSYSYNGFLVPNNENPYFANLLNVFTFDSLKGILNTSKSEVLLSYGSNDGGGNAFEHNTHSIEDTFATNCNVSYFYNFNGHTFPTSYYDTFFTKVIKQPSIIISPNESLCKADSMIVDLKFNATPPVSFDLFKDTVFYQHISVNDTIYSLHLFNEGVYDIRNYVDTKNSPLCKTSSFIFKKDIRPSIDSMKLVGRNCSQFLDQIELYIKGSAPLTLNSNIPNYSTLIFSNDSLLLQVPKGNYSITTISDSNNCVSMLNFPINSLTDSLKMSTQSIGFDCDSLKTKCIVNFQGTPPFSLNYSLNTNSFSKISLTAVDSFYVSNGILNLINCQDAIGCTQQLNNIYVIDNYSLNIVLSSPMYSCDSLKTKIHVQLSGQSPWILNYTKNSINQILVINTNSADLYFSNGNYQFLSVNDASGCSQLLNQNVTFSNVALTLSHNTPTYDCDSNKTKIIFNFTGQAPFQINYLKNGLPNSFSSSTASSIQYFTNGNYTFLNVVDQTGCTKQISESYLFNSNPINASLMNSSFDCDSNKMKLEFALQGNAPWQIQYTKNGSSQSVTSTSNSLKLYLTNGNYQFLSVNDASGCSQLLNQNVTFSNVALTLSHNSPTYDCDSNKTKIIFNFTGQAPFQINYLKNGLPNTFTSSTASSSQYFTNGNYTFLNVVDQTGCTKQISESYLFNSNPINASLMNSSFDCDSNKMKLEFALQGNSPWQIQYTKNGILQSVTSTSNSLKLYLTNGNYNFLNCTDITGCNIAMNLLQSFNYDTLEAYVQTPIYNCDSNKSKIHISLEGNPPFTINYLKNGIAQQKITNLFAIDLYESNGTYLFTTVSDNTNCIQFVNQTFFIQYTPLGMTMATPIYICDSNKTLIHLNVQGNAPWSINFTKNGIAQQQIIQTNSFDQYVLNGNYQYVSITDSTFCTLALSNMLIPINYDTVGISLTQIAYDCDSNKTKIHFALTGNAPWTIYYTKNGIANSISSSITSFDKYFLNGNYIFNKVVDATGCIKILNEAHNFSSNQLSVSLAQQDYNCDSNKLHLQYNFTGNAPWVIQFSKGSSVYTKTTYLPYTDLFLDNGNWTVVNVQDGTGCIYNLNSNLTVNYALIGASIINQGFNCDSNKYQVQFQLYGNAPWTIHYVKSGTTPINFNFVTSNAMPIIYLPDGNYTFIDVNDVTNCNQTLFQTLTNSFTNLTIQKLASYFDCDSNKVRIDYQLTGDGPYNFSYKDNATNIIYTDSIFGSNFSLYLSNGNYTILTISDSKCTLVLNDIQHVNYAQLTSVISSPQVSCDSNSSFIRLITPNGNKPFVYNYFFNSQPKILTSYLDTTTLYLPNGTYFFSSVTDSLGCILFYNKTVNSDYHKFNYQSLVSKYFCNLDSTQIHLNIDYAVPLNLSYTVNGSSSIDTFKLNSMFNLNLSNGTYLFSSLFDSNGCSQHIDTIIKIDNQPNTFSHESVAIDCTDKMYLDSLKLTGKAPWRLYFNKDNMYDTLSILNPISVWSRLPGAYYLIETIDSNECHAFIGKSDTLLNFINEDPILTYFQNYFSTMNASCVYYWYKNDLLIDSSLSNKLPTYGSGEYYVALHDKLGCVYVSNKVSVNYPVDISLFPNPTSSISNILINGEFGDYWTYSIVDMSGQTLEQGKQTKPFKELDLRNYSSGIYSLIIQLENQGSEQRNIMKLSKY